MPTSEPNDWKKGHSCRCRIWLISPYHTGSHRSWALGYQRFSRHQVRLLTMDGRFWKWRMQGGAIELAAQTAELLKTTEPPDLIIATDMVNLPAWLGLVRKQLPPAIPILYYMHENQLTYPWRPGEKPDLTYAMINWLSQLAADHVAFNSHYHAESWFDAVPRLLKHFPDYNWLERIPEIQEKSSVMPVGIDCSWIKERAQRALDVEDSAGRAPLILWNQRWEYDKNPRHFFECLYQLQRDKLHFQLAVAGENFRNIPDEFDHARKRLADQIVHWGYADEVKYLDLLCRADLVISTALHEFFGISILEAIVGGTFPILPKRLSYPELIPSALHPACLYENDNELYAMVSQRLQMPRSAPPSLRQHVLRHYDWPIVAAQYDNLIEDLIWK